MLKIIILFLILSSTAIYSQYLKVLPYEEGYGFYVDKKKYNLPETEILTFRVWDKNNNCERGGDMDAEDFYTPSYFTNIKDSYVIVIYP